MTDKESYSAQEKAADVTWKLAHGEGVKVKDIATSYAITIRGAYRLMDTVSRVIPISYSDSGVWRKFEID